MKINKLTIIALLCPALCQAQAQNTELTGQVLANPFFSDSSLDLSFRNYWKYLKEDGANPKTVHAAWGQGVTLDYQSGYLADIIGVDLSWYNAIKLGASDYFNSRGILYSNGSGNHKHNATGYSKIGQRYIKLKLEGEHLRFNGKAGWQMLRDYGVVTTSRRLSPTTYLGWSGDLALDNVSLRAAWLTRSLRRDSPDKTTFQTNDGRNIDHLYSASLLYRGEALKVQYGFGESDGYLRRQLLLLDMALSPQLSAGAQIYATEALDSYQAMAASKRDFDHHARHYAVDVSWKHDRWHSKWGLGYTDASKQDAVGFYPRHMSKNSRGTFPSMATAGEDYMRDKEWMLATMTDYRLTPELTAGLAANAGRFSYRGQHVITGEVNLYGRWTPSHPALKNLTVWAMAGPGWSYKNVKRTPIIRDGHYQRAHSLAGEVIIDYRFKLL